jgi:dienelactone hydrolase
MRSWKSVGIALVFLGVFTTDSGAGEVARRNTGPWDVPRIRSANTPGHLGKQDGLVREVRYQSEPYQGKDSWVFAYYGVPKGKGPFPAMLLVHGGGGKAFSEWAKLWAERGYVALAMDLGGHGPDGKPLEHGGPPQDDGTKFRAFTDSTLRDMWTYQAVAAILRGHAFLRAQQEVDRDRIGITGISWGGYLTCIVAGIDDQLKVAVPVYGCGFLGDNSPWNDEIGPLHRMPAENRLRWLKHFDPSSYLSGVGCPILFINGTNDFAYPLDSYQKSYRLVKAVSPTLRITMYMPHGHPPGWTPAEIYLFVDSVLKGTEPLARLGPIQVTAEQSALATYAAPRSLTKAELLFTHDDGRWQERKWQSSAATIDADRKRFEAKLPDVRPLTCFFTVADERGLVVSTDHVELSK